MEFIVQVLMLALKLKTLLSIKCVIQHKNVLCVLTRVIAIIEDT